MTDDERLAWDTYAAAALGALMAKNATVYMEAERDSHNAAEYADAMLAERRERTGAREERGQDVSVEMLQRAVVACRSAAAMWSAIPTNSEYWCETADYFDKRARAAGKGEG